MTSSPMVIPHALRSKSVVGEYQNHRNFRTHGNNLGEGFQLINHDLADDATVVTAVIEAKTTTEDDVRSLMIHSCISLYTRQQQQSAELGCD